MNLADVRKKMPSLNGLSDQDAVDVLHQAYYPTADRAQLSALLGVAPPPPPPVPQAGVLRTVGDMGIKAAQGVVDLGSSVVGLGSLATGGLVGKGMRAIGYDPKRTNELLGDYLSDSQKASDNAVSSADGFTDAIAASLQNPRAIAGSIVQSAPGMIGGMGVTNAVAARIATRAALATAEGASASAAALSSGKSAAQAAEAALQTVTGKHAAQAAVDAAGSKLVALGAATEGAQSAGQIADDAQAAGRSYSDYALPALAAGAGTAAIGVGAGKLMGDAATEIATGARTAGVHGNMATRAAKEFISEGLLEEAPQSAQEQYFTNVAQGEQDRMKGVANAAGSGLVTGGVMGAGMGAIQHDHGAAPVALPNTGPLSQAANAGQAALVATANATAPQGTGASAAPAGPSLADIDARMAALVALGQGSPAKRAIDAAGNKVTVPAVPGRPLTPDEITEYNGLKQARAQKTAIPADQQAEYNALLQSEQQQQDQKYAATMEAAKASRSAAEDQQIEAMLAEDERRQRQAEQQQLAQQIAQSDERVEQARLAQVQANRDALREQILNDDTIPSARKKKKAMRAALIEGGYTHADLTEDDHRAIDEAMTPIPSAPNELVDAVPERAPPPAAPAGTNTRAVDDAIAAGMRLKTGNGKLLHKPGSSKVFRLSDAQKAYYLQAIERQEQPEAAAPAAPRAAASETQIAPAVTESAPIAAENMPAITDAAAPTALDVAANEAATSPHNDLPQPTEAQKEAGNYKVGHATLHGLDLSIENPAGSMRRGTDRDGTAWENTMQHHYGYLRGTVGADKDHIDAFIGPHQASTKVYVIDQVHPDNRKFDEHKVMLGFDSLEQARAAYQSNYAAGWTGAHKISATDIDGFKAWLAGGKTGKPFAAHAPAGATVHDAAPVVPAEPAKPASAPAPLTKAELNKLLVTDMSDDQLRQAQSVFAGLPREPKILRELARRGMDTPAAPEAAPAADAGQAGMLANATAPEHIQTGVDERELGEIVAEFNGAQAEMMDGDHPVSNIFQPPAKGDIVRLNDKAKVFHKEHGWMTPAEARVKIEQWKEHARAQGQNPDSRSANSQRVVLSLFDLSGEWSRPWEEAGYQVFRFDIQDDPEVGDVNNFSSDFFGDWFGDFEGMDIYAILAATPCTDFASSGARHFAAKDADGRTIASVKLVHQTLRTIEYFKPSVWALENPVGRIESLGGLPPWRLSFDPNHLGDPYTKKTLIWGRFNGDLPVAPVEPTEGSKMHKLYGGKSMATKNARSVTPEGFSYGFFMANNAIDHQAMAIANKYDRLDRSAIEQAVTAGVTEGQINEAVEDHYYMDMDDDAANEAIRALTAEHAAPEHAIGQSLSQMLHENHQWRAAQLADGQQSLARIQAMQDAPGAEPGLYTNQIDNARHFIAYYEQALRDNPAIAPDTFDLAAKAAGRTNSAELDALQARHRAAQAQYDAIKQQFQDAKGAQKIKLRAERDQQSNDVAAIAKALHDAALRQLRADLAASPDHDPDPAPTKPTKPKTAPAGEGAKPTLRPAPSHAGLKTYTAAQAQEEWDSARPAKRGMFLGRIEQRDSDLAAKDWAELSPVEREAVHHALNEDFYSNTWYINTAGQQISLNGAPAASTKSAAQLADEQAGERWGAMAPRERYSLLLHNHIGKDAEQGQFASWDSLAPELRQRIAAVDQFATPEKSTTLTTNQEQKDDDGHSDTGREGAAPLDNLVAGQDGTAAGAGDVDRSNAGGREGGPAADQRTDEPARAQGARGDGIGAEGAHPVAAGTAKRGRLGSAGTGREGSAVPESDAGGPAATGSRGRARRLTPAALAAQAEPAAPNVPAHNFRITDALHLGEGSELVKFNDNLTAIATLKAIEAENRRATPAEQALLARYVGWGGLSNAFPSPETGEYKEAWVKRGPQLTELLTPSEYALARRSTLDSHYTSKTVVDAMWAAARRLGYQGGLALESSMGAGNFIGLMPEQLAGNTKFVGVEYDSLTARIATLLYPQETVLNAGFQNVPLPDGSFDLAIGNPPFGEQSLRFQFKPELNGHSIHNQFFLASIDAVKPGGLQVQVVSRYLLDKQDKSSRVALAKRAKLLGAIRLPDTAFKENARTSVVTDIVVLQRLTEAEEAQMAAAFDAANAPPAKNREAELERQAQAAHVPAWVNLATVADPLGGEAIPVNTYFAAHPDMVLGSLERSGKMAFRGDITVRPAEGVTLAEQLARAVAALPQDVMAQSPDAIAASLARHKDMSEALRITLAGHENGAIKLESDGALMQVIERETPEGGYELTRRALSPVSPWSDKLYMDSRGQWYTVDVVNGSDGKPLKVIKDGKVTKRNVVERTSYASEADIPASMQLGATRFERLKQMVGLRDLLKEQIARETENGHADDIEANRAALAAAYRAFVKAHGLVNEPANAALIANMPDGALVQALEFGYRPAISAARAARAKEKARPASADPAPILSKRVIVPYEAPTAAASTADALAITLAEQGKVDLERIGALVGKSADAIAAEIAAMEHPLLFKDPESGQWQTRSEYLSGQVKRKLGAARDAGLQQNVAALEAVQPEAWGAEAVTALLGSSWIPSDVYADFITHLSGNFAEVRFSPLTNSFSVNAPTTTRANEEEWGSQGYKAAELVSDLLNSKPIRVMTRDANDNLVVHREYTDLALLKARAIVGEFNDWVYKDGERRARLVGIFNDKFNTRVNRQHDGSHLVLPGKVPDAVISMRRHQKNAIWRGISERFMLVDHTVGAGKTFTAIARAMERRRMGLSKKPAIIVPNHMVEQFASDVYRLYPGAKVLAAGKKDFERSRRRQLFAKIATGDFDIVIIPHSSFGFIGIAPETEERYLQAELAQAQQAVIDAQQEAEENGHDSFRKPFGVKEAERLVDTITARMEAVKGGKNRDRLLTFEQMGIDDLTVDEFHEFKNLFYSSRLTGVKGMGNKTGSQKAFDMYNKIRVLRDSPTGTVTAMTGTPISNSAVEMYTMMRYLAADELRELGLEHFDAWRAQFVSADAGWEPTETGRLKEVSRLGRTWSNMRSLMDLYYSFTDSVDNDDIKAAYAEDNDGAAFPIPRVHGGDRQSVVIAPTAGQIGILNEVLQGFDNLSDIKDPQERNKARLRLMDRARKVSLDVRAADPHNTSDEKGGKLDVLADNVHRLYQKWDADRGTQLVFLDRSVPKAKGDDAVLKEYDALMASQREALRAGDEAGQRRAGEALERYDPNEMEELRAAQTGGWNAYQQIKDNLIARGIPADEIRFVQEANSDAQKKALFDAVNDGTVRVLIGSTPRMGAGTNVQKRLVALHHADVTWKPSDIEQREGRIIRQGNWLLDKYGIDKFAVEILAYATERTIDAKMWSLNSSKLRTINGIRKYDGAFSMDFEDEESVSMAELAALASGDPLLLERVKLMSEIDKLELLKRQHARKEWGIVGQIEDAERTIERAPARIAALKGDLGLIAAGQKAIEAAAAQRRVSVEGQQYGDQSAARAAVHAAIEAQQQGNEKAKVSINVGGRRLTTVDGAFAAIGAALGDMEPFAMTVGDQTVGGRTDAARALANIAQQQSNKLAAGEEVTVPAGQYLGLPLEMTVVHNTNGGHYATLAVLRQDGSTLQTADTYLRSDTAYTTSFLRGAVDKLEKAIEPGRLSHQISYQEKALASAHAGLPDLRARRGGAWPQQGELDAKNERLSQVISQLSSGVQSTRPGVRFTNALLNADGSYRRQAPVGGDLLFSPSADYFRESDTPFAPDGMEATPRHGVMPLADTLSGAELLQAKRDTERLNVQLIKEGIAPVRALRQAPNSQFALARQIGAALGIPVHFVGRNADFEGVAHRGVAFLSEGMRNPELAIAGHETLHALEQSDPALGSRLRQQIRAYLKSGVVEERQMQEYAAAGFQDVSMEKAEGEVLADINGAMWLDPRFWSDLAKADTSLFRTVAYKFMELAAKAISALRSRRFDVSRLVTDIDAVRAIMVDTWARHAQGLGAKGDVSAPAAFSAAAHDGAAALAKGRDADRQIAEAALQYGGRDAYEAQKAAGATLLSYPQWLITKTPNFKQFYGDWEANNGQGTDGAVHDGLRQGQDAGGVFGGADDAAGSPPTFPGQSGPVRAAGGVTEHAQVEPAVYFHGSRSDVDAFDLNHADRKDHGWLGTGVYVTTDADLAHSYASLKEGEQKPNLMPLFVAVKNPYFATAQEKNRLRLADRAVADRFTANLAARGHDGVALNFPDGSQELVAFNPAAVKSAIGNNGAFDAGNADIRFSRASLGEAIATAANNAAAVRLPAGYLVGDLFNQSGKISWWHKTVGTMENLAKRQPAFARVYDAVQSFIGDISRYAVAAADLAPTLLPQLEDFKDVFGKDRKKPLTAEDTRAIGAPIFEGTLSWARDANGKPVKMEELEAQAAALTTEQKAQILLQKGVIDDGQNQAWLHNPLDFYEKIINGKFEATQLKAGVVWSDPELRDLFHLNDHQIALYREFRAALDKSLTNLSISEMVKFAGKDAKGMLEQAIAAPDIEAAGALLRDHFIALAQQDPAKADMHLTTAHQLMDLADKGADLIARGYAPLSRFGKYTVYVQQGEEQVYFGMFETQYEASKMARDMAAEHPDATVTHGTVSEDAYKLFAGVSPETIELFGSMVGLDSQADAASTEVYQTYLKMAKNNRSSMKRLIQRKGIAGFSEDAGRVLAGFIYSNARLTAGNAHLGEVDEAITEIPKQQGELTDAAMQLRESIRNPEGGNKLGGLMFAQFLGGSVASAMVNLTQPVTMTLPYLSQFGGLVKAGQRLAAAVRDAGRDSTGEAHLDEALKWAADEGIVAPQEVHFLQAQAAGKGALRSGDGTRAGDARAALNNTLSKVQLGWGKLFAMAELTNRRVTFIAAYRTAIDEGIPNPARFAEEAVSQTQGTYNSGNKPRWARGAIGGLMMTFKQYSIGYLELLSRMAFAGAPGSKERAAGRRAALYMLAVLFLMSGADGLPFEADLEDVIDGLMQRMGYNYSTKRAKQAFLTEVLGQGGADFALKGISSMPGMPVDVAGRFGMGNLLPGTGLLTKKQSYTSDLGELVGPAGDIAKRAFSAAGKAIGGDLAGAAMDLSPASVRNALKGVDMITTGQYSDGRGYKVNDVTPMEGVMKIVGFQPNSTANIQDAKGQALDAISQNRMRSSEIQEHWAQGIAAQDPAMIAQAREWRDDWNSKNPETPIRINMPAIAKRVRSMRQDAINRTQKTAPAALKAAVRSELSEVRH